MIFLAAIMKKKSVIILASVLVLIFICVLLSTQFGIKNEREIIVSKPILEVSPVLTDLKNWSYWFEGADKYQFHVISSNPAGVTVKAEQANIQSIYIVSAYPDSISSNTHIRWTTLTSGFDWLKQKLFFPADNPELRLGELKGYFENTKAFYGFDINMGKVEDSLVLTKDTMVRKAELTTALGQLFKELQDYANKAHLRTNIDSCRMATFYDEKQDSIHIAAGIPIASRVSLVQDGIRLLEMPAKGKILVGKYQGPYKDLSTLYRAMRKYIFDKQFVVAGAPYEKFLSSPRDSLNMKIELHFPVL
jgi:effector-binding domain-containing protein